MLATLIKKEYIEWCEDFGPMEDKFLPAVKALLVAVIGIAMIAGATYASLGMLLFLTLCCFALMVASFILKMNAYGILMAIFAVMNSVAAIAIAWIPFIPRF
jgi:hypothetical protein